MNDKRIINLNIDKLIVKFNNRIVGYLKQLDQHKIVFQYDEEWLANGFTISPFFLPLKPGQFISNPNKFDGVFGVFNDSLPDGWGQLLLLRMLAKKGINANKLNALTKLSLISNNGLGGLTYYPSQADTIKFRDQQDFDQLAWEAKKILDNVADNVDLDKMYELGGSSGGARPKVHLTINNESWIIKFPSSQDSKEIGYQEYQLNKLAKTCNINVPDTKLFPSKKCKGYFGCKRFDIVNKKRLHTISLSGLLEVSHHEYNLDYVNLFQVIQKICYDQKDMYEAYKRMCFNVIIQNKDDHGKNWMFIYNEDKHGYELSPFYDITSQPNLYGHALSINGKDNPTINDLLEIAKLFKLSLDRCKKIIDDIQHVCKKN